MRISSAGIKWMGVLVTILLLFWLSRHDYLLFHMTVEVFSAVVAGCVFILTLILVNSSVPAFFVIIGCGTGVVAFLTLLHMAAYKGMKIFNEGDPNLATQLWIAIRMVYTGTMLAGVLMIGKTVSLRLVLSIYAAITGGLLASLFIWSVFPDCFIEGTGLTPFKIAMEYIMMGVLAWTLWLLHVKREFFSAVVLERLKGAYAFSIAAGLFFTLYSDVYGITNVTGHLMQFGSYLLMANSLLLHMVLEPQELWFRDLYANESKFRSLTENSPDYISRFDRQHRLIYVNPAGLKIVGRTADEVNGKTFREIGFPEEQCVILKKLIQQVFDTAKPFHTELEWKRMDGSVFLDWQIVSESDAKAQVTSVLSLARDITDRKLDERRLRRNAEIQTLLRKFVEKAVISSSMKELYAEVQLLVGQVLTANLFYINIFDYSTGEIVVPFCADDLNFLPERRPIGNGIAEYVMRLGHPVVLTITEIDRLCKAGEIKLSYLPRLPIQHYLGAPLTDKQGNGFGVMSLVWLEETQTFRPEDIEVFSIIAVQVSMAIERQRSESQLVELCQTLDEASKAKSKFLANMSHELRTPLNGIIGFSSVLKNKKFGALNGTQEEYVENIWISGQHMLSLVNDLLDLSKAEAGKIDLERSWINIKEILQGSIDLFQDKAANRQVQLSIILDDSFDSLVIFADGRRIRQILYNLIDNGIKYNKPGGTLSVTGKKVFMDAQTCAIEILVEDTGIGIKNDNLELLFKPFSQLPVINRTGLPEGTGLGLALTKHLVELHGGEIYVESEFGKGSRFIVLIPLRVKQADGSSEP